MSLWDIAKGAGAFVLDQAQKRTESVNRYKERYDYLDDQALMRKYKSSSGDAKYACALLLKERGYGNSSD